MKVIQSGHQIERGLIIFRRTCTPAILFWEYTYSGGPSNFGHFGQIFWRILLPLVEALGIVNKPSLCLGLVLGRL